MSLINSWSAVCWLLFNRASSSMKWSHFITFILVIRSAGSVTRPSIHLAHPPISVNIPSLIGHRRMASLGCSADKLDVVFELRASLPFTSLNIVYWSRDYWVDNGEGNMSSVVLHLPISLNRICRFSEFSLYAFPSKLSSWHISIAWCSS